jgi:hypothetical protein
MDVEGTLSEYFQCRRNLDQNKLKDNEASVDSYARLSTSEFFVWLLSQTLGFEIREQLRYYVTYNESHRIVKH